MHVVGIGDTLGARKTCNKAANTQMEPTRHTVMHDDVAAARRNKIGPQSVPRGCPTTLFLSRWQETLHYASVVSRKYAHIVAGFFPVLNRALRSRRRVGRQHCSDGRSVRFWRQVL